MKTSERCKGAITVEAAVILPFFIIAVMSFAFILKIYYTHEIVQNALSGACRQMSVYSLLYYKTNAEEVISGIEKLSGSQAVRDKLGENWLTSNIQEAGKDATDYLRVQLALIPAAKHLFSKQLEAGSNNGVEEKLSGLNVVDGFNGLDFSGSKMLADGKSVDIAVSYEMKFPFLSGLLPGVKIRQTASACIWAGEEGVEALTGKDEICQSVWDMTNIKRGLEIRKRQGANLPFNFSTVAKFENGTATSIKSLNIDEPYYKDTVNLEKKVIGYLNKLEEFNGGTCGGVSISSSEISKKEMILVIPETDITPGQHAVIDKCILIARNKGITLSPIRAYGKKGSGATSTETVNTEGNRTEND